MLGGLGVALATGEGRRLRCLGGGVVPDELMADAERVPKLGDKVIRDLPTLLPAAVLAPVTRELGEQLARFCLRHEIAEADLGHVLKLCRWIVREAAGANLPAEDLAADLEVLLHPPGALGEVLLAQYDALKNALREQLVADALVRHGNLLTDIDWRIDRLVGDRHAARLDVSVAVVSLAYKKVDGDGRVTLQLTTDQLRRLAQVATALAQKIDLLG
jgi:hypothetical protein